MSEFSDYPSALKRLASAWSTIGVLSAYGVLRVELDFGAGGLNIGLLGLLFGPALLFPRPWVRTTLIWFTRLGFLHVAYWFLFGLFSPQKGWWVFLVLAVIATILLLIQRDVLMRPDVQRVFDPHGRIE